MDKVIETIFTIEERATRLMEVTSNEKKALAEENAKKMAEFEAEVAENTKKQIETLQAQLKEESEKELDELTAKTNQKLSDIDSYYEANHEAIARKLFNSIINS